MSKYFDSFFNYDMIRYPRAVIFKRYLSIGYVTKRAGNVTQARIYPDTLILSPVLRFARDSVYFQSTRAAKDRAAHTV